MNIIKKTVAIEISLISKDEVFKRIETEHNRFISNYGRVVTFLEGKYQIEKIYGGTESNTYYYVKCKNKASSNYNGKLYIHRLVAEAFCEKPNSFNSKQQVHHIVKFNSQQSNEVNNRASNLMWIEDSRIHKMLDSIECMVIGSINEDIEPYCILFNSIQAFNYMKITKEAFYEQVFAIKQNKMKAKTSLYTLDDYEILIHLYEKPFKRPLLSESLDVEDIMAELAFYNIFFTEEEAEKPKREAVA